MPTPLPSGMARRDNFGLLRLGAATAVLVSHAFGLTGRDDPFRGVADQTLGDVAVAVFFAISGFLVAGSWFRDPQVVRFAARRAKRIWPGLTVAVLFTAFVVGPAFTELPVGDYLTNHGTRDFLSWLFLVPSHRLPGLFASNPLGLANASLWTLPVEVEAYVLVALLGVVGVFRRRWFVWAAWLLCIEAVVPFGARDLASAIGLWPREVYLFAVFLGGALLYRERDRLPLRAGLAGALLGAWILSRGTALQVPMGAAAIPYACLWFAYRTRPLFTRFFERFDLSYGMYLYAYPVEQCVRAVLGDRATPAITIALALPVTVALASFSWRFVERPWLSAKRSGVVVAQLDLKGAQVLPQVID